MYIVNVHDSLIIIIIIIIITIRSQLNIFFAKATGSKG